MIRDFVCTMLYFAWQCVLVVTQVMHDAWSIMYRFVRQVLFPMAGELLADMHFMGLIVLQAWYELSTRICLCISACCNAYAKYGMRKSEQLIHRTWHA